MEPAITRVRTALACSIAIIIAVTLSCARAVASIRVEPEQQATLHVGEIAALQLPSDREYTIVGSAGSSLVPLPHGGRPAVAVYRAAQAGNQTLIATPKDLRDGDCISCVTVHYFVRVVP